MKRMIIICLYLFFCGFQIVIGQTFELTIQNQTVSGTDFIFDIYMLRTGETDIYLGNADLVLTFNDANFTDPEFVRDTRGLPIVYGNATDIVDGNKAIFNINQPTIEDQDYFDAYIVQVENIGLGTFIATVKLTNISNPTGTAGLQWVTLGDNACIVNTLANSDPWGSTDISSGGTYTNPTDSSLPVELTSFQAELSQKAVILSWITENEVENQGFNIYRNDDTHGKSKKINLQMIKGAGNKPDRTEYSFTDRQVKNNTTYFYQLEDVSFQGHKTKYEPIEVRVEFKTPKDYYLAQNYPNPFSTSGSVSNGIPATKIEYGLLEKNQVKLYIYNIQGQQVRELVNQQLEAGYYDAYWDGRSDSGQLLPTGLYFYQLTIGRFQDIKKVVLAK